MDETYRAFCQTVIDNIKKNGFPEKKVAFSLVKMYEAAEKKNVNLNKVLETLRSIEIEHEKTPEKIVFYPRPKVVAPEKAVPHPLAGIDFSKMDVNQMMAMAGELMKQMTPEQLAAAEQMARNLSSEEQLRLIEQAKMMGLFPKEEE